MLAPWNHWSPRWLSWVYAGSPLRAALAVLFADAGVMFLLMCLEGIPPWQRHLYFTVMVNDLCVYPVYAAMVVLILRGIRFSSLYWFMDRTFHVRVLYAGFVISAACEIIALATGEYTLAQELSPSKAWHTVIFGVMFYWMVMPLPAVFSVRRPRLAFTVVLLCIVAALTAMAIELSSPFPPDAHLTGTYVPWEWHVRH